MSGVGTANTELYLKLQSSNHKHPVMAYLQQQGILLLYKKKTTDDIMIPSVLKKTHAHQIDERNQLPFWC